MTGGGPHLSRRQLLRAAGVGALATLPACSPDEPPSQGRTLRMAGNTFGFPSPFAYIGGRGYEQMSFIYDTLLWTDGSGQLLPWLARRWQRSRDGRTYRFELRDGVAWHDGQPLTADDVAFTFAYFQRQPLGPLLIAQPDGVVDARVAGERLVDIRLRRAAVTFPEQVAAAVPIIPRHVWADIDDAPGAQERDVLVGTGPYRLESFSRAEGSLAFAANEDHFLGPPHVGRLELVPVDDQLAALRAGRLDVAETPVQGVRPETLAPLRDDDRLGIIQHTGSFTLPLIFNAGRGGALADPAFRRACAHAIDRPGLVEQVLGGNGEPGNPGFLPPAHPFHAGATDYPADVEAAAALLDEAGYAQPAGGGTRRGADGQPLRFEIVTGNAPVPTALPMLIEALDRLGVELEPTSVDLPTLFGRLGDGDVDLALSLYPGPGGTGPHADPDVLRTFYSSRMQDRIQGALGWADAEFDRLAAQQLVTADEPARRQLLTRLQRLVARDVPALPLYYPTLATVFRREVFDAWYYTPGGFAGGLPGVRNKHVLVTGARRGLAGRAATPATPPAPSPGPTT